MISASSFENKTDQYLNLIIRTCQNRFDQLTQKDLLSNVLSLMEALRSIERDAFIVVTEYTDEWLKINPTLLARASLLTINGFDDPFVMDDILESHREPAIEMFCRYVMHDDFIGKVRAFGPHYQQFEFSKGSQEHNEFMDMVNELSELITGLIIDIRKIWLINRHLESRNSNGNQAFGVEQDHPFTGFC